MSLETWKLRAVAEEVAAEMKRAEELHGPIPVNLCPTVATLKAACALEESSRAERPMSAFAILGEEVGEVGRGIFYGAPLEEIRAELVQVAAMAEAYIIGIDRILKPNEREPEPEVSQEELDAQEDDDFEEDRCAQGCKEAGCEGCGWCKPGFDPNDPEDDGFDDDEDGPCDESSVRAYSYGV